MKLTKDELEVLVQTHAQLIGPIYDEANLGFVVIASGREVGDSATYTTNSNLQDVVKLLREAADTIERREDTPPEWSRRPEEAPEEPGGQSDA